MLRHGGPWINPVPFTEGDRTAFGVSHIGVHHGHHVVIHDLHDAQQFDGQPLVHSFAMSVWRDVSGKDVG